MRAGRCVLVVLVVVPACLWRSYGEIMAVHVDVLLALADKTVANAEAGRRPTSNDVVELTYPLQRGQQFAHQFEGYRERDSYRHFVALLGRYEAFVQAIDAARVDPRRWEALQASLKSDVAILHDDAAQVRAALARGA